MRLVVALGGNALRPRGDHSADSERHHVATAVRAVAGLAANHQLVVTHGNGPQVGLLAVEQLSLAASERQPLDVLDAESQGWIGYLLTRGLWSAIPERQVVTVLTQVAVDADDPAFNHPNKPVGPLMDAGSARRAAAGRGWTVGPDGAGMRRLVASPQPRRILELAAIRLLMDAGVLVICAGGGGIPVAVDATGALRGVEAVVDKDLSAALLASALRAEGLVLLTDVEGVYADFGTAKARLLSQVTPALLRGLDLPEGSMAPKAEAAGRFVESGGAWAAIGSLESAFDVVAGVAGTRVVN
ncbi:MAG TPA: carbamate kinase [Acidimicrobiales bacterium]|nr:carbamate kinase [Acidimicrobiales bacterium]